MNVNKDMFLIFIRKLGVQHASMPSAWAVTSLIYAGVEHRNVNASMQPLVLSKERFLCCVISNVALHGPRLAGMAGAQARSLLCGGQVDIGCLQHSQLHFAAAHCIKQCILNSLV